MLDQKELTRWARRAHLDEKLVHFAVVKVQAPRDSLAGWPLNHKNGGVERVNVPK